MYYVKKKKKKEKENGESITRLGTIYLKVRIFPEVRKIFQIPPPSSSKSSSGGLIKGERKPNVFTVDE